MISNSSPLIILSKINKLDLLEKIFRKIIISPSVFEEVIEKGKKKNSPDSYKIEEYFKKGVIKLKNLSEDYKKKANFLFNSNKYLHYGETETICLALQEGSKDILINERFARKIASMYNLNTIGTLGILLIGFKKRILNKEEISDIINKISLTNFRISRDLIEDFWKLINELKKEKQ